jgi:hypothetical protein
MITYPAMKILEVHLSSDTKSEIIDVLGTEKSKISDASAK